MKSDIKVYILRDYYSGKQVGTMKYESEKEAYKAQHEYLKDKILNKEIHNNLITVERIYPNKN